MKCEVCGTEIEKSSFGHKVLCSGKCFFIDFWNECLDEEAIIIGGCCYHDGGVTAESLRGFDGALCKIKMNDGRVIETNNLRYNGQIPEDRNVKDNAVFI